MERKLICPCGLTCCDCMYYQKEVFETAETLRTLIRNHKLDTFLTICSRDAVWTRMGDHLGLALQDIHDRIGRHLAVFKHMPEFMAVLDGLIELQCKSTCQEAGGCSLGGDLHRCRALQCLEDRGYEGCWQCNGFESCEKLAFLKEGYGYVIEENLRIMRDQGPEAIQPRGDNYYEWQRKLHRK